MFGKVFRIFTRSPYEIAEEIIEEEGSDGVELDGVVYTKAATQKFAKEIRDKREADKTGVIDVDARSV